MVKQEIDVTKSKKETLNSHRTILSEYNETKRQRARG